ncbi:unnamed protein product [Paramecium sonneborni]|uniref:Uncharacterized protein n=1 Tax=Paramecium sonneborni TaxID=65129 RepID=A0A8S1PM22_9CILI|nr:unnamed protein product [Paramecium sonneborni]
MMQQFENDSKISNLDISKWEQNTKELEIYDKCEKIKIKIIFTKDYKIIYSRNSEILRVQYLVIIIKSDIIIDISKNPEILINLELIRYFKWQGEYGLENKKCGRWIATFQGNILKDVGGYFVDGFKQGIWKVIKNNFWTKAKVYLIGEYYNDLKRGQWKYIQDAKIIYGGYYNNEEGYKKGKWVELGEGFYCDSQIIYRGEYNKKGIKIGQWDILQDKNNGQGYISIGCGYYHIYSGNKIGRWVELDERFQIDKQVMYSGEYNKNGKKVGRWDSMFCKYYEQEYQQIGGGSYDNLYGIKVGKWIDLWEGFKYNSQITYNGEYNQDGVKVDRWNIEYKGKSFGGGLYDSCSGNKIGKWVDLDEEFWSDKQVTYSGVYNQYGKRIGRWDITLDGILIGGGSYDIDSGIKIRKWVELDEKFDLDTLIIHNGQYNITGKKVGRWDIMQDRSGNGEYRKIGGGSYDCTLGIKVGQWVELKEGYTWITYVGEYNMEGKKIGTWVEMDKNENQKRGQCQYNH